MAIKLIANYAKRLGLPGYSSHQFSVTCEAELTDLAQVPEASSHLYELLQEAVDREIQHTGFVPGDDYGEPTVFPASSKQLPRLANASANSIGNGRGDRRNGPPAPTTRRIGTTSAWRCSDRQRELLNDLAAELGLDEAELDTRSRHLFGRPARELNKANASSLISELLAEAGTRRQPRADAA
jgi:hypothetical protein